MQRLALVMTAIAVLTVGCKDQRILQPPASQGPAYMISDGRTPATISSSSCRRLLRTRAPSSTRARSIRPSPPSWKSAPSPVTRAAEHPSTA